MSDACIHRKYASVADPSTGKGEGINHEIYAAAILYRPQTKFVAR